MPDPDRGSDWDLCHGPAGLNRDVVALSRQFDSDRVVYLSVKLKPLQDARLRPNRIGGVEVQDSYEVKGVACQFSATKSDQG